MRLLGLLLATIFAASGADPLDIESFEKVWQTINEKHYSREELEKLPNGQSWAQVHGEYRAKIDKATTSSEVRRLMREMIALFGRSHYAISGPESRPKTSGREGGPASPGFAVEWIPGPGGPQALVTRVSPGTPAARAGIRLGWRLLSVAGVPVAGLYAPKQRPIDQLRTLRNHVSGFYGEKLRYAFATKTISLTLPEQDGSTGFGFIQGLSVEREYRRLGPDQKACYCRLSMFLDAVRVLPEFEKWMKASTDCRGFVIDLRGNPGGIAIMANALSGWFVKESGIKLGTMYQRDLTLNFVIIPRLEATDAPLAILMDGGSASTSEIMAGGLQNLKRARIFGTPSAGAALPSLIELLPNGDLFQFAVANYVSEDGKELEGRGVQPDVLAPHTRAALDAQKDRALEAALDWIYGPQTGARRPRQ